MIEITNYTYPKVKLYNNEGTLVATLQNKIEFLQARVQIKEKELRGYYIEFDNQEIRIDVNGSLENYPDGLYDEDLNLLMKLI